MSKHLFPFSINNPAPNIKNSSVVTEYGFIDDDKRILDLGLGSSGCFPLGFLRHDIIDNVASKLKTNPFCQSDFATTNIFVDMLSERYYQLSDGYYSMFSMSGSDAVEGAIKIAKMYSKKKKIIGFENSYHGSTFMSSSVSDSDYITGIFGRHQDCITITYNQLDMIDSDTLMVIIETCSWQNGLEKLSDDFWIELRKRCDDNDALLVIDDIAFCNGKTGAYFGWQVLPIKPDVFCIGKGITGGYYPLSATLINEKVAEIIKPQILLHGFAYSFPMSGIIAALEFLDILEEENILEKHNELIAQMNEFCDVLVSQKYIIGYRNFGVCFNLLLNEPFDDLWDKDVTFYKHGLHIGVWNNYRNGILIMLPLNANGEYFRELDIKLRNCFDEINQQN